MKLLKYHGLGNDFLILVDLEDAHPVDGSVALTLCERHRGVGADGLIRVSGGAAAPVMELYNADGSRAETSGNGLRCLVRALGDTGLLKGSGVTVSTDGGPRRAELHDDGTVTVDLTPTNLMLEERDRGAVRVALDNPHVVVRVDDPALVDLREVAGHHRGVNVEVVTPGPGPNELTMRVWERGVGETQSCGSGSCAAALAGRHWGLVGDRVVVHQPGGRLIVDLSGGRAQLTGPATYVCRVEVDA